MQKEEVGFPLPHSHAEFLPSSFTRLPSFRWWSYVGRSQAEFLPPASNLSRMVVLVLVILTLFCSSGYSELQRPRSCLLREHPARASLVNHQLLRRIEREKHFSHPQLQLVLRVGITLW